MAQPQETLDQVNERLLLPDEQLAISALTRNISDVQERLRSAEHRASFLRGYTPTHPGPAPHPEAGGMDHEDWKVAQLEYQFSGTDEEIDEADEELERAENTLFDLNDLKSQIGREHV